MIQNSLSKAGYVNLKCFHDGEEAWTYLREIRDDEDLNSKVSLIITAIEMHVKGNLSGADAQLSKPEIDRLPQVVGRLLERRTK